ncbi:MAG: cupin domain-containing protein [Solirubrobacteraceae bacterium]|nr:cupin domain-containing protein [Solirubrobacteraceae bacterium]
MATSETITDDDLTVDPVLGLKTRFWEEGDAVYVESWISPGGGVTPHVHPVIEERFEVVEGTCQLLSGRTWTDVPAGETVVVPPGTRHAFRNRSDAVTHFVCRTSPWSSLQEFLEDAASLSRAGGINRHAMPTSWDALLQAAVMIDQHREMVELGFPLPPAPIQKVLMPRLAAAGRKRGYAPGRIGDRAAPSR